MEIQDVMSCALEQEFAINDIAVACSHEAIVESSAKKENRTVMRMMKDEAIQQPNIQPLFAMKCQQVSSSDLLHQAVAENQYAVVQFLISHKVDLNQRDANGRTALMIAVEGGNANIAKLLIDNRADLEIQRKDGLTPLEVAISMKNETVALALVNGGANPNNSHATVGLLASSIANTMFALAKTLIEKGATINVGTDAATNPVCLAFASSEPNRKDLLNLMISKGLDSNYKINNEGTVLFYVVRKVQQHNSSDLYALRLLCENRGDVHFKNKSGESPVSWAISSNRNDILLVLNDYRKDQSFLNQELNKAVQAKNRSEVERWIGRGGDINNKEQNSSTNLYRVFAEQGDVDFSEFLVQKGAKVSESNLPYVAEILEKQQFAGPHLIRMARFLFANKQDVNQVDKSGRPLICAAVMMGNLELVNLLTEMQANVEPAVKINGMTPLHLAINFNNTQIAERLLRYGANVNTLDKDGFCPVARALVKGNLPLAESMIAANKPNLNVGSNADGTNPLQIAVRMNYQVIAGKMISQGANVNYRCPGNRTVLFDAIEKGDLSMIQFLLNNMADVNVLDSKGVSPMALGISQGRQDIVQLLMKYGANLEPIKA